MRRPCWASTSCMSISRGWLKASLHGVRRDLVELDALVAARLQLHRLQQVPGDRLALAVGVSRQVDGRRRLRGFLELLRRPAACRPGRCTCGSKSFSMSMPRRDFGRSRTCPTEACTSYLPPRMLERVRAFAGDSTMTRLLPVGFFGFAFALVARLRDAFFAFLIVGCGASAPVTSVIRSNCPRPVGGPGCYTRQPRRGNSAPVRPNPASGLDHV